MTFGMPHYPEAPPPAGRRWRLPAVVIAVVAALAVGAVLTWRDRDGTSHGAAGPVLPATSDTSARAPAGRRITVRVINGTRTRGLARRATMWLRDFGYDVVDFDSAPAESPAATVIEVHTNHPEWGTRVQKALGTGRVTTRPDSLRYVDLTVRLGHDWSPPTESLRP